MKTTDLLRANPRGTKEQALAYYQKFATENPYDVVKYIAEVYRVAPQVGIDPSIVIAQADLETDRFRSDWWRDRLNPAGLGITGDSNQNRVSPTFESGAEAARAQVAHLLLYATGTIIAPLSNNDDPRYDAYVRYYGNTPMATTIAELSGRWATDPRYAEKIVARGREVFGDLSEQTIDRVRESVVMFNGTPWQGYTNARVNGHLFHGVRRRVTVRVDKLNLRVYADTTSEILRTAVRGETLPVIGWVNGELVGNERRWWIGADYARIWCGGTSEKPT
jgi:hypothetical protein